MNTYGYVGSDPLTYTDPLGLCPACIARAGATGWRFGRAIDTAITIGSGQSIGGWIYDWTHPPTVLDPPAYFNEADNNESKDIEGESCPSNDPDNWEKIPRSNQAYRPKDAKEPIFEKDRAGDRSHGGSAWKKWNKERDWKKGRDRDGTYNKDGVRTRD